MKQQLKEMQGSKACSYLSLGLELTINQSLTTQGCCFLLSDSTIDKKMQIFQRPCSDHDNEQSQLQNKNLTKQRK